MYFFKREKHLLMKGSIKELSRGKELRNCDIVIYNKKYVFGLHPISGTKLQKLLEFPKQ